jgi:hypothetical protein
LTHACSGVEGSARGVGAHRVDADDGASGGERLDHRQDATLLLVGGHAGRAGARRFAAHVDDVCALRQQLRSVGCGRAGVEPSAAVGEGVGRDIDDAHDKAALQPRQVGGQPAHPVRRCDRHRRPP